MGSAPEINQFNEQWRSSPLYAEILRRVGIDPQRQHVQLSDQQREQVKLLLEQNGVQFPNGTEIDAAGNMNENEGFGKQLKKWGPIVAGGAAAAFGIPGLMPGLIGGGAGAGASGAGMNLGIGGGLQGGSTLGSLGIPGLGAVAPSAAGGGGISGFLGGLGKSITKNIGGDLAQRLIGGAGAGIAGASQAAANNRGVGLDAAMQEQLIRQAQNRDYQDQLLARSADDRESLSDAFTKSVQANRVMNSTGYKPPMISTVPGQGPSPLPSFGTGFSAPTSQQKGDAQALYNEASKRLYGGSQLPALAPPTPYANDPNLLRAGAGEKIGNWLGPGLSALGAFRNPTR
jgi:hypothetical protein